MGRHSVVEIDPPTVALRRPAPVEPADTRLGAIARWMREKTWSLRQSLTWFAGAHLGLVAVACVVTLPRWLYWGVLVAAAATAITRSRAVGPRLLLLLGAVAAAGYLVRVAVLTTVVLALGYTPQESVDVLSWIAHPGSVVLGVALAAALDAGVRVDLQRLRTEHLPALTATPARAAATVGVALLVVLSALLPVARTLAAPGGFALVTPASAQASSSGPDSATVTTALGCAVDEGTGVAGSTCTRDALIERVCDLDVDGATASETSSGMTVWLDDNANMVKFSSNFTPTVPFTEGGVECVAHTVQNGYPAAVAHDLDLDLDLDLDATDWDALVRPGALPSELDSRIDQA